MSAIKSGDERILARATTPPPVPVRDFASWNEELSHAARQVATSALVSPEPLIDIGVTLEASAFRLGIDRRELAPAVLDRALSDTRFAEVPPSLALRAYVEIVAAAAGGGEVSLWVLSQPGVVTFLAGSSGLLVTRRMKVLARETIEDNAATVTGVRTPMLGVPVHRFGLAHAALVLPLRELSDRETVEPLARYAAVRLALMLERYQLLEQGESRDRTLVEASERRLIRTAYDLHDGPLQEIALLAAELRLFASDIEPLLEASSRPAVREALASIDDRTVRLEFEMREISRALETSVVGRHSLDELLEREAAALTARTGIEVVRDVRAEFDGLSDSQRIVLYRGVQETLSNVARHSGASKVTIRVRRRAGGIALRVVDNGAGFDATQALAAAARRGRLGLVGIGERVRLLGGVLTVTSLPDSGTTVGIVLPAWAPPGEPRDATYSS